MGLGRYAHHWGLSPLNFNSDPLGFFNRVVATKFIPQGIMLFGIILCEGVVR